MREGIISKKAVKDRIREWLKEHPQAYMSTGVEWGWEPYDDQGNHVQRTIDMDHDLYEWRLQPDDGVYEVAFDLEEQVHDKAKQKLTPKGKRSKKKDKQWQLEYQWVSRAAFHTHPSGFWGGKDVYDTDWHLSKRWRSQKFVSSNAALNSLKSDLRNTYLRDTILGRGWRVRNLSTGEIKNFEL